MFRPPPAERVVVPGPAGAIEAVVEAQPGARPVAFAVVCHPDPQQGGTLQNKVVHTLARAFQELGAATVRFNFRGVGASEGSYGEGIGESEDASAVIQWARKRCAAAPLWLAGFSFGGAIAIRVAALSSPALLVTVAPAVRRVDRIDPALSGIPWLIIQGDADDVVPRGEVEAWAAQYAAHAKLAILPGASHFFHGRLPALRETVLAFCKEAQKKSPAG